MRYGVTRSCIMNHLKEHSDDIRYGIEVSAVSIADTSSKGVTQNRRKTIIYREGVIKLGYFIRSVKAAAFRQWSTDLTVAFLDNKSMDMTELLDKLDDRINKRFDSFEQEFGATRAAQNQRFDKIEGVCRGFRDEIDELREMLNIMFTDDETEVVRSLIRESKVHQVYSTIQTSQREGMKTMNQALYELYQKKLISYDEAFARTMDPDDLGRLFKR